MRGFRLGLMILAAAAAAASCAAGSSTTDAAVVHDKAQQLAPCDSFGGMIHGSSICVDLLLETAVSEKSLERIPRNLPRVSVACSNGASGTETTTTTTSLRNMKIHVECTHTQEPSIPFSKHVAISATIVDDVTLLSTQIRLDERSGYWDFVDISLADLNDRLRFEINYGVLD
jgi:hypothetical protein